MKKQYIRIIILTAIIIIIAILLCVNTMQKSHDGEIAEMQYKISQLEKSIEQTKQREKQGERKYQRLKAKNKRLQKENGKYIALQKENNAKAYNKGVQSAEAQLTPKKIEGSAKDGAMITYADGTGYYLEPKQVKIRY